MRLVIGFVLIISTMLTAEEASSETATQQCELRLEAARAAHNADMRELEDQYERKLLSLESSLEDVRREQERDQKALEVANQQIDAMKRLLSEQQDKVDTATKTSRSEMPALVPKQPTETIPKTAPEPLEKTIFFEAATFITTTDAHVCDAPSGATVEVWEPKTSFTSNQKRDGWIRVTGYFVDRKWRPSRHINLWIDERSVERKR